jgi:hypothetical protein
MKKTEEKPFPVLADQPRMQNQIATKQSNDDANPIAGQVKY